MTDDPSTVRTARRPPHSLAGYDPRLSRLVDVPGAGLDEGRIRTWHVLDTGPALAAAGKVPAGTILAVHGNPTWSYLWRRLAAEAVERATAEPDAATEDTDGGRQGAWRVIAVDQLEMGYSERTRVHRGLEQRVADLGALTQALDLSGPVVSLGHDWGGAISLGWALAHPELLAGVALLNTAVWQPEGTPIPAPLRLARARALRSPATALSTAFLNTTLLLAKPQLDTDVRRAYRSPYESRRARLGIDAFVDDIPVDSSHRSFGTLEEIAEGIRGLDVPTLLLWGPEDPIFSDRYLNDLITRLPQARVHRFEGAGHLLAEDAPYAPAILDWLGELPQRHERAGGAEAFAPLWQALDERSSDPEPAVIEMPASPGAEPLRVSWRTLADRVDRLARGLHRIGVRRGDRVSLLVQPGATLTAVVYACLRIGAVVVVADAGLGVAGLGRAIRGAWPAYLIADTPGLLAARARAWPGVRISVRPLPRVTRGALRVTHTLPELIGRRPHDQLPENTLPSAPAADDDAAVLFTSGSTGPAKGVIYTHRQLAAVRDALASTYGITDDPGLVTGFAPFALLGPALGTRSVTPRMKLTSPRTLTATAVADAVRESNARVAFLSPAAILGVTETAHDLSAADRERLLGVDRFLSTGAPIGRPLLDAVAELMPRAAAHTPYGMTECLLVTDITREQIDEASRQPDAGVCVGRPIPGATVLISALDADGRATGVPSAAAGVLGEIVISAPHLKRGYDRLWLLDREASRGGDPSIHSHRTADVGHLDDEGRLWIEGRLSHVISTAEGLRAPVGIEQAIEKLPDVRRAAAVGVGPAGTQQIVAVLELAATATGSGTGTGTATATIRARPRLAGLRLTSNVRAHSPEPIAAVFVVRELPTDIRHNSKIDRTALAAWATATLSGEPLRAV